MQRQTKTDVLVVGAGMAGLCAAASAMEKGARVIILEKGARPGGSMAISGGRIWTFVTREDVRMRIPQGDIALQDFVVDDLPASLDWLAASGVALEAEVIYEGYRRGRQSDPAQMTSVLVKRIEDGGGDILRSTSMQSLLARDGAVTGAVAFDAEGSIEIEAHSVVLASGGYQGNAELLARYVTPHADCVYVRSNPCSTGDGLLAALDVGAAVTPYLDTFYGHPLPAPPARFNALQMQDTSQKYGPVAVALNLEGQRFADESAGTGDELLNFHIASQPRATAVFILDANIAEMSKAPYPQPRVAIERVRKSGGAVIEADTLESLADKLQVWGLPARQVLSSLAEFNAEIKSGCRNALHPPRRANMFPIERSPFTAVPVRCGITFTCGGLCADLDMRVLRRAASISTLPLVTADAAELRIDVIPNLYVAGCDLGGISNRGYMGGLAQALVTGRAAGASAATTT